jgi:hypothetical protein
MMWSPPGKSAKRVFDKMTGDPVNRGDYWITRFRG